MTPSSPTSPTWIVADVAEARHLLGSLPREGRILPITTSARALLLDCGLPLIDPRLRLGTLAKARTLALVRRARSRYVAAVMQRPEFRQTHREFALDLFHRVAYTSYRLWFTIGAAGPWMVLDGGAWRRFDARADAHRALVANMLRPVIARQTRIERVVSPPMPALYRRLRRLVLRLGIRGRTVAIAGARKGMFGLVDALLRRRDEVCTIIAQPARGGLRDYLWLARSLWRAALGHSELHVAFTAEGRGPDRVAEGLIAAIGDPIIATALQHYRALLNQGWRQIGPGYADALEIVEIARPRHYLSAEITRLSDWLFAEATGAVGGTRWVICRVINPPAPTRLAEEATLRYFHIRFPENLVDRFPMWTPHGVAGVRQFLPRDRWGRVEAVAAVEAVPRTTKSARRTTHRVLLADTFAPLWSTNFWIYQTSDEYRHGLLALLGIVRRLPSVSLLIRAKKRAEFDLEAYAKFIGDAPNISVKSKDDGFLEDLAEADLLIASRSTTIEQAFHARCPVLLWSGASHYRYLPARSSPPTPHDRSALYAAASPAELETMLPAILAAHAGRPLTDAEIAPHVWPAGTRTIDDLASEIVDGPRAAAAKIAAATVSPGAGAE